MRDNRCRSGGGSGARKLITPAEREDKSNIVLIRRRIRRTAVERVVESERGVEILPQFALDAEVGLHAVPADAAQARVVLDSNVEVFLGAIVGVVRRLEEQ